MTMRVAIVGAGIIGRLLGFKAAARGWRVTLFERGGEDGGTACSTVPPAMLAPYCELDVAEKSVSAQGARGLELWPEILRELDSHVYFQQAGSLVVAHPQDCGELERFARTVAARAPEDAFRVVQGDELRALEPELDSRVQSGLFFPTEGQIDSRGALAALLITLKQHGVDCRFHTEVQSLRPHEITVDGQTQKFDMVFDCRGIGAAADLSDLRAVRGEIIRVHAPDVRLNRPVRLLHPRWPLYAVPRPDGHYIIGATSIESDDVSPITLRSAVEILSAAFALSAGFSEARILETSVGLRPAFPDNEPRIMHEPGLIRINGMYRHGFLLAPIVTDSACGLLENANDPVPFQEAA